MEPVNDKTKILRPRLSKLEVEVIICSLTLLSNKLNGATTKDEKTLTYVKQLSERFQHLEKGSDFLRSHKRKPQAFL